VWPERPQDAPLEASTGRVSRVGALEARRAVAGRTAGGEALRVAVADVVAVVGLAVAVADAADHPSGDTPGPPVRAGA
jgi:hypothetical protein